MNFDVKVSQSIWHIRGVMMANKTNRHRREKEKNSGKLEVLDGMRRKPARVGELVTIGNALIVQELDGAKLSVPRDGGQQATWEQGAIVFRGEKINPSDLDEGDLLICYLGKWVAPRLATDPKIKSLLARYEIMKAS